MKTGRTIVIPVKTNKGLEKVLEKNALASAGPYSNITGMRNLYWGKDALIVKYGVYIYFMGKDKGQGLPFAYYK